MSRRRFVHGSLMLTAGLVAATSVACSGGDGAEPDATTPGPSGSGPDPAVAPGPEAVALDAFLAGFPLVTTVRTMQTFAALVGVNRLFAVPRLSVPEARNVVAPNRDTTYVIAVLDLRAGPRVLSLPEIRDRYHVVQLLDAWMGGFGLLGTRATGGRAGAWAIVPPGFDGPLPDGVERLACPTNQAIVLGRIRAVDDADAAAAAAIGRQMRLEPLPSGTGTGTDNPPEAPEMPSPVGTPQTVGTNGVAFFDELGDALVANPPATTEQRRAIEAADLLGVGAGRHPADEAAGRGAEADDDVLTEAVRNGLAAIADPAGAGGRTVNGWAVNLQLGRPETGTDLRQRALVARYFWGPVPAEEAVYPRATSGSDGLPLDGSKRYRITFEAGGLPPVDGFWSVTAYGPDMFFVANPANRYSLSGDTPGLVLGADGSLDLYLQHEPPTGHEANWLPVPAGPFNLIARLYLPGRAVLEGRYELPPVTVTG